jgi:hypothetical protein
VETQFKVPSDIPADPVAEGEPTDSPIPDVQDGAEEESDEETGDDVDADDEDELDDDEDEADAGNADTPE